MTVFCYFEVNVCEKNKREKQTKNEKEKEKMQICLRMLPSN